MKKELTNQLIEKCKSVLSRQEHFAMERKKWVDLHYSEKPNHSLNTVFFYQNEYSDPPHISVTHEDWVIYQSSYYEYRNGEKAALEDFITKNKAYIDSVAYYAWRDTWSEDEWVEKYQDSCAAFPNFP